MKKPIGHALLARALSGLLALGAMFGAAYAPVAEATIISSPMITANAPQFSANFAPSNIFDNFRNSDYASLGGGAGTPLSTSDGTWLEFDFGAPTTIDGFINLTRFSTLDAIASSRLVFSDDPTFDAADPSETFNPTGVQSHGLVYRFAPQTVQYVRWEVLSMASTGLNAGSAHMWFLQSPAGSKTLAHPTVIAATPHFGGQARFDVANAANGDAGYAGDATILGTEYASASGGTDTFVDFDFGVSTAISGFDFFDRGTPVGNTTNPDRVSGFDLLFSDDPTFTTGVITRSYGKDRAEWTLSDSFAPVTARYVRYDVTGAAAANSNTGLQEILFYTPVPEPTTAILAVGAWATLATSWRRRGRDDE